VSAFTTGVQYSMELIGIFVFGLSGAFAAVRKDFDIFGTIIITEATCLGGGLFRDLVLGITPVAFTDLGYQVTALAAALMVFFSAKIHRHPRLPVVVDVLDTAALALFSVVGAAKVLDHDFGVSAALVLGMSSALGGSVLAAVLRAEVADLFQWNRDLYILPALTGAVTVILLDAAGLNNGLTAMGAAILAFSLRMISIRYGWHTPRAFVWRNPFAGMREQERPANPYSHPYGATATIALPTPRPAPPSAPPASPIMTAPDPWPAIPPHPGPVPCGIDTGRVRSGSDAGCPRR
jgi:uncharacterized membrane protein YeiH